MTSPDPLAGLLEPFLEAPHRAVILSDFDGTLAPIVVDPEEAMPLPGAVDLLHRLARTYQRVAVVSGRPVSFLCGRLKVDDDDPSEHLVVVGLYGMERAHRGAAVDHPDAVPWRKVVAEVADAAEAEVPDGVQVERKGLSMALHFRTAPEEAEWARAFAEKQAASTGLLLVPARMAFELRPPIDVHKGTVVAELVADCDNAVFLGDDRGDLEAFEALDHLRADGRHVLKVAVRSAEGPPELLDQADLVVDGPAGALDLLRRLGSGAASR